MQVCESEARQAIVEIGRLMYQKGWVAANDGNLSVRLSDDRILCTPTGVSKGRMEADDLILVDGQGTKIEGRRERTSEILMHLTVYQLRPDVCAVAHAHPPVSTGFALAGRALNQALLPEVVVNLGCVPLAGYGLPGTPALSEVLVPLIPDYDALLMANHGVVAYGSGIWEAFYKLETVEHTARITLIAELLGGPKLLARKDVEALFAARRRYGVTSPAQMRPGAPQVAEDAPPRNGNGREKLELTRDDLWGLIEDVLRANGALR